MATSNKKRTCVFDLHCDTLTKGEKEAQGLIKNNMHLSLEQLPDDYRICQCMAVFIPDTLRGAAAEQYFKRVYAYYQKQLEDSKGKITAVTDVCKLSGLLPHTDFASILTVEGGAVLAGKLENLYYLHRCGVKMMTLTWNNANEICGGVASGEGFTPFGRQVVPLMEEMGMAVDVSHLSDKGFYQLCHMAKRPFVASHSNARAVCAHPRNLTDDMFREICRRGGLVGLNYYTNFIAEYGSRTIDELLRHVHHFLELGGEHVLALGSDFDGADLPPYLSGVASLPLLREAFLSSGIPANIVDAIFFENAYRFFTRNG